MVTVIVAAAVGAAGAIAAQIVNNWLASGRERARAKVAAFEMFNSRLSNDPELRRIRNGKEALTDGEIEYFLDFLEEIGLYFHRDLVDLQLLDEILGDDIIDWYNDDRVMKWVGAVRGEKRDSTYFAYFERMAVGLSRRKKGRTGASS